MAPGRVRWLRSTDALLAVGFVAADAIETIARHRQQPLLLAVDLPGAFLFGCVAIRRRRPLLAIAILTTGAAVGTLVEVLFAPPLPGSADAVIPIFAMLLLTYSLGAHGTKPELAIGAVLPLLLVLAIDLSEPTANSIPGALLFFAVFIVGLPAVTGRLVRWRRSLVGQLQEQERVLDHERSAHARSALAEERVRIADRLHGTLMTGIESLAERARAARGAASERQGPIVATIESDARALLAETRGVVVALASDHNLPPLDTTAGAVNPVVSVREVGAPSIDSIQPWFIVAGAAFCLGLLFETRTTRDLHVALPVAIIACLTLAVPLAVVWIRPLLLTCALWAAASLFAVVVGPLGQMFTAIALSFLPPFGVACFAPRRQALVGLGVCCLGQVAVFGPDAFPSNLLFVLASWAAGWIVQDSTRLIRNLRSNRARLAEQHDARLRQAMLEERARYARDLHDSIGHALTIVALQAGAARRMWSSDSARSVDTMATIERVANGALRELRRPIEAPAQARLNDIEQMLQDARTAGLNVDLRLEGDPVALSPDAQLAAYRLVQEALTNVLKHAPGARAHVTVVSDPARVELHIVNSQGGAASQETSGNGRGLGGMRQRVESCGGALDWGPRPEGGFEVNARFPVDRAVATS